MTVLEVGTDAVRVLSGGGGHAFSPAPALVRAALDWMDDPVGLYDDRPVLVAELWRTLLVSAVGQPGDRLVVVYPDDWPAHRVHRILAAANSVADDVAAVRRSTWMPSDRAEGEASSGPACSRRGPRRVLGCVGAVVIAVVAVAAGVVVAARPSSDPPAIPAAGGSPRTVVEGRVVVAVPQGWTVTRVTEGPGSRRLQVTSPSDPGIALHVTQAYAPETTLGQAAGMLADEIAGQPAGLFVGFRPDAQVFGRAAVVYREVRPGRFIDWTVMVAGSTRIGVGCQSTPGHEPAVAAGCEAAVRSARESGTESSR